MARSLIASDNFNRAAPIGANWTNVYPAEGAITIAASTKFCGTTAGQPTVSYWAGTGTFSNDQYSSTKIATIDVGWGLGYSVGAAVRIGTGADGARSYYSLEIVSTNPLTTDLVKVVSGTRTVLATSTAITWAVNDLAELEAEGTTVRAMKNGSALGGAFTVSDSALAAGKPGIVSSGAATTLEGDDWEAGNITAGSAPTISDVEDESLRVGETGVDITGTNFGSTQGTGSVRICPSDDIDDVNGVNQTVTAWGDAAITFDVVRGTLPLLTNLYLFVQADAGSSNATGHVVQLTPPPAVLAYGARLVG